MGGRRWGGVGEGGGRSSGRRQCGIPEQSPVAGVGSERPRGDQFGSGFHERVRDFEDLLISPEGGGWCSWFPEGVSRRGGSPVVVTGDVEPRCDVVY